MTKQEILKSFLEDDLLIKNGHLKEKEVKEFSWTTGTNSKLIEVIKLAIEGELSGESSNITERKINQFLNKQL